MWQWCCSCCSGKRQRTVAKMQQQLSGTGKMGSGTKVHFQAGDSRPLNREHPVSDTRSHASRVASARVIPSSHTSICFPPGLADSAFSGTQDKDTFSELKWTVYPSKSDTKHPKLSTPQKTFTVLDANGRPSRQDYAAIMSKERGDRKSKERGDRDHRYSGSDSERRNFSKGILKLDLPEMHRDDQARINKQLLEAFAQERRSLDRTIQEKNVKDAAKNSRMPQRNMNLPRLQEKVYSNTSSHSKGRDWNPDHPSATLHKSGANMLKGMEDKAHASYHSSSRRPVQYTTSTNAEPKLKSKYCQRLYDIPTRPPQLTARRRPLGPLRVTEHRRRTSVDGRTSDAPRSQSRTNRNTCDERRSMPRDGRRMSSSEGRRMSSNEGRKMPGNEGRRMSSSEGRRMSSSEGRRMSSSADRRMSSHHRRTSSQDRRMSSIPRRMSSEGRRMANARRRRRVSGDRNTKVSNNSVRSTHVEVMSQDSLENFSQDSLGHFSTIPVKPTNIQSVSESRLQEPHAVAESSLSQPFGRNSLSFWFQNLIKRPAKKSPPLTEEDFLKLYSRTSQTLVKLQASNPKVLENGAG